MAPEAVQRRSASPYVERVWRGGEEPGATHMQSVANSNWELVVWQYRGQTHVAVRGPETKPTVVPLSPDVNTDFRSFGIVFSHGTSMPHLPVPRLLDNELVCPHTTGRTFVLRGEEWELPTFDNAEIFAERLVRAGLLIRDPLVADVVAGDTVPPRDAAFGPATRRRGDGLDAVHHSADRARPPCRAHAARGPAGRRRRPPRRLLRPAAHDPVAQAVPRPHRYPTPAPRSDPRTVAPVQDRRRRTPLGSQQIPSGPSPGPDANTGEY